MEEMINSKTCGECRFYAKETEHCKLKGIGWKFATDTPCSGFTPRKPITNGDVVRQGGNRALAQFAYMSLRICRMCAFSQLKEGRYECTAEHGQSCIDGIEAWLNAPADCVKQNENHDTQTDLCKAENTQSEEEDEP